MKKIITTFFVVCLLIASSVFAYIKWHNGNTSTSYRCVPVERGRIESLVSCSGALEPTKTVQVGTQVSGIITSIFVDFNDQVRANQTIALIDTTLLVNAVGETEATLERSRAQYGYAKREFSRVEALKKSGMISDASHSKAEFDVQVARAAVKSATLSVERARRNLDYATIVAPISGIVVERNVDVGQTVAASLSAPQLFLIANNLSRMQILASVDESDIGQIRVGQTARFRVQAYPTESFTGTVKQVRLQSSTSESVVSYTVIVDVANDDQKLLPGMTATVDFIVKEADNVYKVANAALRFHPTHDMMVAVRDKMRERWSSSSDSSRTVRLRNMRRRSDRKGSPAFRGKRKRPSALWYLDEDGSICVTRVRVGITDGKSTEISGRNLTEGMQVIAGISSASSTTSSKVGNPFQSQQIRRRRGPRGGGF